MFIIVLLVLGESVWVINLVKIIVFSDFVDDTDSLVDYWAIVVALFHLEGQSNRPRLNISLLVLLFDHFFEISNSFESWYWLLIFLVAFKGLDFNLILRNSGSVFKPEASEFRPGSPYAQICDSQYGKGNSSS